MKTWDETKREILKKLAERLPQQHPDGQMTIHMLQNHPVGQQLLDAFVGIYREAEVLKAYVQADADMSAALDRMAYEGGIQRQAAQMAEVRPVDSCECGAQYAGFTEPGPGHSKWCKFWRGL